MENVVQGVAWVHRVKNLVKMKTKVLDGEKDVLPFLSQGLKNYKHCTKASLQTQYLFLSNSCRPLG